MMNIEYSKIKNDIDLYRMMITTPKFKKMQNNLRMSLILQN